MYSAAIRRGLIEVAIERSSFPRRFAAASLKLHAELRLRLAQARFPRRFAAASLKREICEH